MRHPSRRSPLLTYPATAKGDVVEDYHGTKVADPYRWMEDLDGKETADWVAASNAVTEPYLEQLPLRKRFNERLTELWNYPRVSIPRSRPDSSSTRRTPGCSGRRRSSCAQG